ncbi:hypothetical protein NL676_013767 [Syzygium grande]|nr:hypothetical protein NL676_013767 [Syzygium grande]
MVSSNVGVERKSTKAAKVSESSRGQHKQQQNRSRNKSRNNVGQHGSMASKAHVKVQQEASSKSAETEAETAWWEQRAWVSAAWGIAVGGKPPPTFTSSVLHTPRSALLCPLPPILTPPPSLLHRPTPLRHSHGPTLSLPAPPLRLPPPHAILVLPPFLPLRRRQARDPFHPATPPALNLSAGSTPSPVLFSSLTGQPLTTRGRHRVDLYLTAASRASP